MKKDRLFVPLNKGPYYEFKNEGKEYELRVCNGRFSEKFVFTGREVELRLGYSGESLIGCIGRVTVGSIDEIFTQVNYKKIEPCAVSREDAMLSAASFFKPAEKYIAFEVLF